MSIDYSLRILELDRRARESRMKAEAAAAKQKLILEVRAALPQTTVTGAPDQQGEAMSATPGLTVYPKGVLLETLRRRIIALQDDRYNDDFLRALREAHRALERKDALAAELAAAKDEIERLQTRLAEMESLLNECVDELLDAGKHAFAEYVTDAMMLLPP